MFATAGMADYATAMTDSQSLLSTEFATLPDLVRAHAAARPDAIAVADAAQRLDWAELDKMADRIAARLQADGLTVGAGIAIADQNSAQQVAVLLGAVRAGACAGLVTTSTTGEQMAAMVRDTGAPKGIIHSRGMRWQL